MPEVKSRAGGRITRVRLMTLVFLLISLQILLLSVSAFAATPAAGSILPPIGQTLPNTAKTFTATYTDPDGWKNLNQAYFLISTTPNNLSNSVYLYYDQNTNKLYLRNDANTAWLGGFTPGSPNSIENSQAKIDCSLSKASGLGTALALSLNLSFKPLFSGKTYNTYLAVTDDTAGSVSLTKKGAYIINQPPQAGTITPSSGSSSVNQPVSFTTTCSDPDGWQNLQYAFLGFYDPSTPANPAFILGYDRLNHKLYLSNDTNTGWLGGFAPGSSQTIENSQAKLDCSLTAVQGSGNTLSISWKVSFKPTFTTGQKKLYLSAIDSALGALAWTEKASWSIIQGDTTAPQVSITSPANNSTVSGTVNITASATDNIGIGRVEFYLDNSLFFQDTASPYVYSWNTLTTSNGAHTIKVIAYDTSNNQGQAQLAVNVNNLPSDNTPPTGSITINNNAGYTNSTAVTLSLSAQDNIGGLGLDKMQFSNDNTNWSTPEAYVTTKSWTLLTGDGTKTVYVKFSDKAGNWSTVYSDTIILSTANRPPVINAITPFDSSTFLAGAKINIQIDGSDPDSDALQYQFSIGGAVKQPWSASNTYIWQTTASDTGAVSIACEVKDSKGALTSKAVSYSIINPAVEETLQKVADNYAKISDFSADMTLSSTLDGKSFGATDYCRYYFKAPNKEKTETFNDATRTVKNDIIIISGANMHLIDPINNIKQTVDLLVDAGINSTEFSQLDLYYNQALFLSKNTVSKNDLNTDFNNMIIALDATPNEKNNIYDKLGILIDYEKGLIVKIVHYKNDELPQMMEVIETKQMPNSAWLGSKLKKTPNLKAGNLIVILNYDKIQINTGLTDSDFDPNKQF